MSDSELNSYVEYQITVKNLTNNTYVFKGVIKEDNFYNNEDIVYELEDISVNDVINPLNTLTFKIKFKYDEDITSITNNTLAAKLGLDFERAYNVSWENITGTFPTMAYQNEDLTVNIGSSYDYVTITIGGREYIDYNYSNGVLTIYGEDINGDIVITPTIDNGSISASVSPNTVDISTGDTKLITLQVANTYNTKLKFNVDISNNNFELVDLNGDPLNSFQIDAQTTTQYNVYVKKVNSAIFYSPTETAYLTVHCNNGINANTNTVTIKVPFIDTTPPTIGAINLVLNRNNGNITVNWTGEDENGGTINYTINLYDGTNALVNTYTYSSSSTSELTYTINNTTAGKYYYVKIYGEDISGNNGAGYLNEATTTSTYCRKSNQVARYSVTYTGNHTTRSNTDNYVLAESTYSTNISVDNNYQIDSYQIRMGGTTLIEGEGFTFNDGTLSIPNVNGNIQITITTSQNTGGGGCLIKGTQITLANGTTKNIEDVNYTDLLLVWDYEHGKFTYEYPIWIEKEGTSNYYQKTTFSDGSTLNTVSYHGVFSLDLMKFVSVDNKKEFHIGTRILKTAVEDGKYIFKEVKVTNIEYIYETTNYYQVITTTYYNVISDDFITTDGNVILVNLYEFNNDFTWQTDRLNIIKNKENLFEYSLLESVMPYYMFIGLRAAEVKYISNLGYFTMDDVPKLMEQLNYYNQNILLEVPKGNDGYRYWMVTTNEDIVDTNNKLNYLVKEGTYYTLPQPVNKDGFLYWYNTADGKTYSAGEQIKIWTGMHFIAIYE